MELEGLYRDIVEASADGIWVFDLSGRTLYTNTALARMFGESREKLAGLTVFDTLDEVGREQFTEHLAQLRQGVFNTEDVECKFVRGDGSYLWVLVSESPLRGPDGSLHGVLHRLSDYSERRRILDDLTTSRHLLAEAQRIARLGSWNWDVAEDLITASQGLLDIYGLSPETFPARYSQFMNIVHEEDRQHVDAAVQAALRDGGEFVFEARVQGEAGWIWTRGRGVAVREASGRVVAMSGTHQDITETKLAEIALQDQIAQNALMQSVAVAANEARTLNDVLAQAQHLVLLHDDWVRGRAFVLTDGGTAVEPLYIHDADRAADEATPRESANELALANRCLQQNASVWDEERLTIAFPVLHDGAVHAVLTITSAPPLYRHDMIQTMVEQVAVQLGRVVEREQAERELADARDLAMEASRQKSDFLATMSHEIRTPLNGVIGLNDLLLRTRLDADQQRLASGGQAASRALLGLINDILDFSKIEAGKLELERLDFEVRPVFDQVATVLGQAARAKGLELMVACDPSVPEVLSGDPTRLAQVVTNLGSNAVKFTEAGEVLVRATAERVDGRRLLRVEVSDTGIGIDAAHIDELFESFTQADASTTRVHGGTGLGLAISREIVHALGGEIGVDSSAGRGSVFWFTAAFDEPAGNVGSPEDEYARAWLSGRRALVVDDNERHRQVLQEQLGWWRMRTAGAASSGAAEESLERALAAGDPFDLVLIDRTLALPSRNGLQLARRLRRTPAYDSLTLLMMTSTADLDTAKVREHGIVDCLTKPVLAQSLRTSLLEHLAGVVAPVNEHARPVPGAGRRRRILVVEDNPVNQMVAVGLLDALGYDADTAADGVVALERFESGGYDAVLMDVQMPRLDGYAATRELRRRETGPRVPVLAMTAAAVEGERERCLAAGMDDFLTKPVDPDALSAALTQWLAADPTPSERRRAATEPVPQQGFDGLDLERLDMLRDMGEGSTTYLDRAIGNFVANTPGQLAAIGQAVADHDPDALRSAAHRLAGSASNLGVVRVGQLARDLELLADRGTTAGAADLLPELAEALAQGRTAVLAYQAAYQGRAPAV